MQELNRVWKQNPPNSLSSRYSGRNFSTQLTAAVQTNSYCTPRFKWAETPGPAPRECPDVSNFVIKTGSQSSLFKSWPNNYCRWSLLSTYREAQHIGETSRMSFVEAKGPVTAHACTGSRSLHFTVHHLLIVRCHEAFWPVLSVFQKSCGEGTRTIQQCS